MKMAELSTTTGISVATIKYYLRQGLVAPGERTHPNQANYTREHVRRVRLVKSLLEVGGLSVAAAGRVIRAIDSDLPLAETFEIAQKTVSEDLDVNTIDQAALDRIDEMISDWDVHPANPGRVAAAHILATYRAVGQEDRSGWFDRYAAAALLAAEADLDEIETRPDRETKAETVVVGTVLGDALFAALRRAAQEHITARRYGSGY